MIVSSLVKLMFSAYDFSGGSKNFGADIKLRKMIFKRIISSGLLNSATRPSQNPYAKKEQ